MFTKTPKIDLVAIEQLAKNATPGPWTAVDYGDYDNIEPKWYLDTTVAKADYVTFDSDIEPNHWNNDRAEADFKYIAAVNPSVFLKLVAEVRKLHFYYAIGITVSVVGCTAMGFAFAKLTG